MDVNLLEAWEFTTGSPLITVAVLDSGVEKCNPDFDQARFLSPDLSLTCVGADYVTPAYPCCPPPEFSEEIACDWGPAGDNLGHGTICAGIIAATVGNGIGIAGMDRQCRLLAARVQGNSGTAGGAYGEVNAARYIVALERIASMPEYRSVRVISMSIGLPTVTIPPDTLETLTQAIDTVRSQNRFIVAAAGNGGANHPDLLMPQSHPSVICVGAIDPRGWRMAAPSVIAANGILGNGTSGTGAALDFMAPGTGEVHLTCDSNPCPLCPNRPVNPYPTFPCYYDSDDKNFSQGTSWAAPKVAAAISLLLAEAIDLGVVNPTPATNPETWPGLTFTQVFDLLKAGARDQVSYDATDPGDPLDTVGRDNYYGWGLIDIGASMCALHALAGQPCP